MSLITTTNPNWPARVFLIKWMGSKLSILKQIIPYFPKEFNTYYEPFVGGGSVFFKLQPKVAKLNDINPQLMGLYECVKNSFEPFWSELNPLLIKHNFSIYEQLIKTSFFNQKWDNLIQQNATYFYLFLMRKIPKGTISKSGLFQTGGLIKLYRSEMNQVTLLNTYKNLLTCHEKLNLSNVTLSNLDWQEFLKDVKRGDFVYFDPPYDRSDNSYGYGNSEQFFFKIMATLDKLHARGVKFAFSHLKTLLIQHLLKEKPYKVYEIQVRNNLAFLTKLKNRPIAPFRTELLICNYDENEEFVAPIESK